MSVGPSEMLLDSNIVHSSFVTRVLQCVDIPVMHLFTCETSYLLTTVVLCICVHCIQFTFMTRFVVSHCSLHHCLCCPKIMNDFIPHIIHMKIINTIPRRSA